jgi:hypothetical protein
MFGAPRPRAARIQAKRPDRMPSAVSCRDMGSQQAVAQVLFAPFWTRSPHVMSSGLNRSFVGLDRGRASGPAAPKKNCRGDGRGLLRPYRDPLGAWSGVVKGSSLESTTKTASKLADSLSLAFSLIL